MKSDNELIAEFMGEILDESGPYRYDLYWDCLIPVVNKIAEYRLAYPDAANEVCNLKLLVLQQVAYKRVVEFVKWYNKTIKKATQS